MKWKRYSMETTTDAVDVISASFHEIGIDGIEIEDKIPLSEEDTKGMFIDILPELPPDDGIARISFYLDAADDHAAILQQVKEVLSELRSFMEIGKCEIEQSETEDIDWINNWKEFFKPFMVGNILIKPTWEEIPADMAYETLIQIDPGTAFGTGSHETTKLCITQLEKHIKNSDAKTVLDIGTGSGILGIAALKLGAKLVVGTDLDEAAIEAVHQNMASNGITEADFKVIQGNILDEEDVIAFVEGFGMQDAGGYDIVVANILAPVIILLSGQIHRFMKKGGLFITSGIIDDKEEAVVAAMQSNPNLEIIEIHHMGEWVNITARRV